MKFIDRARFAFHLHKDQILPVASVLLTGVSGLFSIIHPTTALTVVFVLLTLFTVFGMIFPALRLISSPYSQFFLKSAQAMEWLRKHLQGSPCLLQRLGIAEITVVGIACTDVGDLFTEIVSAVAAGLRFRVVMLNPEHPAVSPDGLLPKLEPEDEVGTVVQRPLARQIEKLQNAHTHDAGVRNYLRDLHVKLERTDFASHRACIEVCAELWALAGELARKRTPTTRGGVELYFRNEMPELRQWVLDGRALLYSVYAANPGVGSDNPSFLLSAFDGRPEQFGQITKRAHAIVNEMVANSERVDAPALATSAVQELTR